MTVAAEPNKPDRQWRSSSFQESKKVPASRDLWPWPWPWAHAGCRLTWRPSCASLVAIRPFVCEKKRFAPKFYTDGRTDDGRLAIALAHSWNELKTRTKSTITQQLNHSVIYATADVVRLEASTPAHQALEQVVATKAGRFSGTNWRRPPGRPRRTWIQQVGEGTPARWR